MLTTFNCLEEDSESFGEQEISGQPEVYDAIVLVGLLDYQQQTLEGQGMLNHLAKEGIQVVVYKPLVTYERSSYILPSYKVAV